MAHHKRGHNRKFELLVEVKKGFYVYIYTFYAITIILKLCAIYKNYKNQRYSIEGTSRAATEVW